MWTLYIKAEAFYFHAANFQTVPPKTQSGFSIGAFHRINSPTLKNLDLQNIFFIRYFNLI